MYGELNKKRHLLPELYKSYPVLLKQMALLQLTMQKLNFSWFLFFYMEFETAVIEFFYL